MDMPSAVNHLTIRVQDLDRTAEFFEEVFGWDVDATLPDRRRIQIGRTRLVFKEPLPGTPSDEQFNEFGIGIDHISFGVEDREALEPIVDRLREAGLDTEGVQVEPATGASVVVFRDPDNIQWEFYSE